MKGIGDVTAEVSEKNGKCIKITLKELLFVLDLQNRSKGAYLRLMSVTKAKLAGCQCIFAKDEDNLELENKSSVELFSAKRLTF